MKRKRGLRVSRNKKGKTKNMSETVGIPTYNNPTDVAAGAVVEPAAPAMPAQAPIAAPVMSAQVSAAAGTNAQRIDPATLPDPRSLPEVQQISEYLRTMKFKKRALGGCDEEDVLKHFERVVGLYERAMENQQSELVCREAELEQQRASFEAQVQARQAELEAVGSTRSQEVEQELALRRESLEQEYRAKADELLTSLTQIERLTEDAKAKATMEASAIVAEARQEGERIEREAQVKAFEAEKACKEAQARLEQLETAYEMKTREIETAVQQLSEGLQHMMGRGAGKN